MLWNLVIADPNDGELTDEDLEDVSGGAPPPPGDQG